MKVPDRVCLESQVWMEVRGSWKSLPYAQQIIVDSWISVGLSQLVRAALTKLPQVVYHKKDDRNLILTVLGARSQTQ